MKRKSLSKSVRFSVFARDGFTCRYCGRQSDIVELVVDHVLPVCQGGTNDIENLITACVECNQGKAGKTITQSAPTETDRLRLAQEYKEQFAAAEAVKSAALARATIRQEVCNFFCELRGQTQMDTHTLNVLAKYVEEHGAPTVLEWIAKAAARLPNNPDYQVGQYVSGIRRSVMEEASHA